MKTIYLDNNATTAVAPEVRDAMLPYLTELYGNPSSMHTFGGQVGRAVEDAREKMAALLGAQPEEILFTSCGSESDNTAIWSALQTQPEKRRIITTRVEHPAILNVCQYWERQGYHVTYLGVDGKGRLDLDEYAEALSEDTALVSIMMANNEVGNIYPVQRMAEMAREKGVLFHTDAVQAVGKVPFRLSETAIDMLSLSGHKLHAPKGIGVLYIRKGVRFRPFLRGGHQERGRRAGTENVPYIIGMGEAMASSSSVVVIGSKEASLYDEGLVCSFAKDAKEAAVLLQAVYNLECEESIMQAAKSAKSQSIARGAARLSELYGSLLGKTPTKTNKRRIYP